MFRYWRLVHIYPFFVQSVYRMYTLTFDSSIFVCDVVPFSRNVNNFNSNFRHTGAKLQNVRLADISNIFTNGDYSTAEKFDDLCSDFENFSSSWNITSVAVVE